MYDEIIAYDWNTFVADTLRRHAVFFDNGERRPPEGAARALMGADCHADLLIVQSSRHGPLEAVKAVVGMKMKAMALFANREILTGAFALPKDVGGIFVRAESSRLIVDGKEYSQFTDTGAKLFPQNTSFYLTSPPAVWFDPVETTISFSQTKPYISVRVDTALYRSG